MDKELQRFFDDEVNIETLTRQTLIRSLLSKHTATIGQVESETSTLKKRMGDLDKERNEAREKRDKVNEDVNTHKQVRQTLHQLANEKRRTFFILMEKLDDLEKLDDVMDEYRTRLDKMEWELQTTSITANDEKVMIKRMKEIYAHFTEANKEAQEKLGIQEQISTLTREIGENLADAQHHHELLLEKARESDQFHDQYVELGTQLSEVRIKYNRSVRMLRQHKESIKYWKEWIGDGDE